MIEERFSPEFQQEFYRIYDRLRRQRFEPALSTLSHNLGTLLDARFAASSRLRLRVEAGRIKSANRLLLKAQLPKYDKRIVTAQDVFQVITDVVGTRITCNTIKDVYSVAEQIKGVMNNGSPDRTFISTCPEFEDDYIKQPKESGYRALGLLVGVPVAIGDRSEPVTCEIQIRTLLQHAWGELTHEDTYKPEMVTPPLIVILSKRLANALAVLDEIAQDIRDELYSLESAEATPINATDATSNSDLAVATGEEQPVIEMQESTSEDGEAALPAIEEEPSSSETDELRQAFNAVFGRDPVLSKAQYDAIAQRYLQLGISDYNTVRQSLQVMAERVKPLESEYTGLANLTDYGRFMHSGAFFSDPDAGVAQLERSFRRIANTRKQREDFALAFPPAKEVLGTVVHVASDYALVQLSEGVTGIVHVTAMKKSPRDYLDVHDVVAEGETVRVRIVRSDPVNKRIELALVDSKYLAGAGD